MGYGWVVRQQELLNDKIMIWMLAQLFASIYSKSLIRIILD